jgi:hypothetical protein
MPDTEAPEQGTAAPEQPEPPKAPAPDRLPDDHPLVKAYMATKNELNQAKGRVKEFEDATKSEHEKLTERASELEQKLTTAEAHAARFEIALEKGLTKSQAKRLVGSTREELEADADELLEDLGVRKDAKDDEKQTTRTPRERLRPGASPEAEPEETDPAKLADAVQKAKYGL